jgi:glycosyltransferase involved in cell wall biosynthesis
VEAKAMTTGSGTPPRHDFLLYLGRLVPYKRVDVIVGAGARHGVRTVIAGDGPDRARLEKIAGKNVEFLGAVSEAEAGRLSGASIKFWRFSPTPI